MSLGCGKELHDPEANKIYLCGDYNDEGIFLCEDCEKKED